MSKVKIFNDPVHGFISVPQNFILELIEHPYFQRMRRIKQLGLTELVYPGALHTRFHHALGAFHLMTSAVDTLRHKGIDISESEKEAAQAAILLHDVGHGPFSHALERSIVKDGDHEEVSSIIMQSINQNLNHQLEKAIEIFDHAGSNQFLHELIASQLDVDRLDYLSRDSFYTGVSEGVIGLERIIKMMNVHNDRLCVEHKGIYSVEKFLVSRRLMYWQVYLHKTVVAAEKLLLKILERAQALAEQDVELFATPAFKFFLYNKISKSDFRTNQKVLDNFADLDDHDLMVSIKCWTQHQDQTLATLCQNLVDRKLLKTEISDIPFSNEYIDNLRVKASHKLKIPEDEAHYFVFSNTISNEAYIPKKDSNINILMKENEVMDIAKASDQYNISALSKSVEKYFICYPSVLTLN
ncbi:MAG: phosphohydrolase [Bacteroidetes bacterium SW_10_40_5]|nr:MAG: phosphohydrolase [Bacteroidetes bacterium SW_10_40_5]